MLDMLNALRELEEIETAMADLYQWYGGLFIDDTEAVALFSRLWLDELAHQSILRNACRIVRTRPGALREISLDFDFVNHTLAAIGQFRRDHSHPVLAEALTMAFVFEKNISELHTLTVINSAAEDCVRLMSTLRDGGRSHHADLLAFAKTRGVFQPAAPPSPSGRPATALLPDAAGAAER
jgi:hypothetical protein